MREMLTGSLILVVALLGCTSEREERARAARDRARLAARNLDREEARRRERAREERLLRGELSSPTLGDEDPPPPPRRRVQPPTGDPALARAKLTRRLSKIEARADKLRNQTEEASPPARARVDEEWGRFGAKHEDAVDRVRRVEEAPEAQLATFEAEADKRLDELEISLGRIASKLK